MAKKDLLDDLTIKTAKPKEKPYTMRDGGSLFVLVHPNGSKYFHVRTKLHGKEKKVQLGTYPTVTLKKARVARDDALRLVKAGKDPVLAQRLAKQGASNDADNTFKKVAIDWLEINARDLAPTSLLKIQKTFEANVFPIIGEYPIKQINNLMVRKCLTPMQKRGALEYMSKTRSFILEVFKFALADAIIEENPITEKDMRLVKHEAKKHPRLKSLGDAGKLLRKLDGFQGSIEVQTCVYLQLHFAQRPSELRLAQWTE